MNITKIDKEVAPVCQAASDLVDWAEQTAASSVAEVNDRMIVKAVPLFGPLKQAIEDQDAERIFQLARMVDVELQKRPGKLPPQAVRLHEELEKVLHAKGEA